MAYLTLIQTPHWLDHLGQQVRARID
jgi:hypothetical protein